MSQSRDLVRAILLQMYPGDGIVPPANEVEKFDACVEDIVTSPRIDNSYLRAFDDCVDINDLSDLKIAKIKFKLQKKNG